jgi:ankyrin repeat protein
MQSFASRTIMKCNTCDRQGDDADSKLMQCSICATVKYCSTYCQREDWPNHKKNCTTAACLKLFAAIQDNDSTTVARLAKTKRVLNGRVDYTPPADDDFPDPHEMGKWTGLHQCVRLKNVEMMKILIENGANLEIKDVDGETPTFVASSSSAPEVIKVLLDAGANPNACAEDRWTCLMVATRQGDYESTKALLEAGADLYLGRDMFGRGALEISSMAMSGNGMRMSDGESMTEATARHRRVNALLSLWV